jgi:hypothetical protein
MTMFKNGLIPKPIALSRYPICRAKGGSVTEARYLAEARCCCSWVALQ